MRDCFRDIESKLPFALLAINAAFTRLINSTHLTEKQKQELIDKKSQLNPFELKKNLEEKLKVFLKSNDKQLSDRRHNETKIYGVISL